MSSSDSLSAEDLRSRLYHSLRQKGLVDSLKSQLRNKLVGELKNLGVTQDFAAQPQYAKDGSLLLRSANSLVADHLRRCNYDYSLSVFLPESGTAEDKLFTTRDLLQLLHISPQSKLYKNLTEIGTGYKEKGFLWQLLCEIASKHGHSACDTGMQTDDMQFPSILSLHDKFKKVDEYYSNIGDDSKARGLAVEERILAYQRQLDERSRTEIQLEIARFKDTELGRMRMEERDKLQTELDQARREMERTYQAKSDALVERERNAIERLQKQQEIAEKESFSQRQSILGEIEVVRQREAELRRTQELALRETQLWEDKMKSREELVKQREDHAKKSEIEFEQRLHEQTTKFKLEEQARYLERYKDLEYREFRVKEDERRLDDELREIKQVKDELREKRIKVNELDAEVQKMKHDLIRARAESESLSEKLRETVDYQVLKEDHAIQRRELENIKSRLAEAQRDLLVERQKQEQLLREMGEHASRPTPEVHLLNQQLEKGRTMLRQEQALAEHQRQQVETRLHEEMDRNREMLRRYEEQSLQMKEMNHELQDLRQQLGHTRSALSNEIYRNPKTGFAVNRSHRSYEQSLTVPKPTRSDDLHIHTSSIYRSRSVSLCDLDDPHSEDLPFDPILRRSNRPDDDLGLRGETTNNSQSDDYSYSFDLVHDTKRRLKNLEKEAENLEQNYRDFQHRMTNVGASLPYDTPQQSSPVRSKVNFIQEPLSRTHLSSITRGYGASQGTNYVNVTQQHSFTSSHSRPLSSTPAKSERPPGRVPSYMQEPQQELDALDLSVSTVRSTSPVVEDGRRTRATKNRPMLVSDLEARPGSPSVLIVEGSVSHLGVHTNGIDGVHSTARVSPPGQEEQPPPVVMTSTERNWATNPDMANNQLKEEDKRFVDDEEQRRKREEEDREYEERRKRREEERRRKEQEAWEREQKALEELQKSEKGENDVKSGSPAEPSTSEAVGEPQGETGDPPIDPVMQKYMNMVQQQKEREQEVTKKAVDAWSKGRKFSQDRTPSMSEQDISVAADDKSSGGGGGGATDDDFDW